MLCCVGLRCFVLCVVLCCAVALFSCSVVCWVQVASFWVVCCLVLSFVVIQLFVFCCAAYCSVLLRSVPFRFVAFSLPFTFHPTLLGFVPLACRFSFIFLQIRKCYIMLIHISKISGRCAGYITFKTLSTFLKIEGTCFSKSHWNSSFCSEENT